MNSAGNSSAGPPGPKFAQIPLPPGMTLEQYTVLQGQLVTIAITVAVAFAIIVWDYFVIIRDEIQLYRSNNKQLWLTPATWAFIILRYSAFLATLPSLFFTSIQAKNCQLAVVLSQVGVLLVVASSGIIFCYRVVTIWSGSKYVYAVVSVFYLGMLSCWIAVASQYSAITGPPTPFGSNCQMEPIVSWAPISYASSVGFDVVILLLTALKMKANQARQSPIGRQIYRDSLFYFLATAATNITVLSIQALGHEHDMIKPTAVPFSTVITVAMAQRVFLNLKLFTQRQQRAAAGLPLSAPSYSFTRPVPPRFPQVKRDDSEDAASGTYDAKPPAYPPRDVVYISKETVVGRD